MTNCPKCNAPTRMQVQAVIAAPGDLTHGLSKRNLRRKDVYLMGVLWETANYICTNEACRHIVDGYGNYVTDLQLNVASLTAERDRLWHVTEHLAMQARERRVEIARLRAELDALKKQEPVTAQHRFRHPQKTLPDWSEWQPCKISPRDSWTIDSQGYEVEYRPLYAAPVSNVPNIEPLYKLLEYADESDGAQYGTLSTSLVRDLVNEALVAPKQGEPT